VLFRDCVLAVREFQSGTFVLLGALLGARLSRRAQLMQLRVERRTQIFDEACDLTAQCSYRIAHGFPNIDEGLHISLVSVDRKIATHFSPTTYNKAWRTAEEMMSCKTRNV
jgi:hypothetical protein